MVDLRIRMADEQASHNVPAPTRLCRDIMARARVDVPARPLGLPNSVGDSVARAAMLLRCTLDVAEITDAAISLSVARAAARAVLACCLRAAGGGMRRRRAGGRVAPLPAAPTWALRCNWFIESASYNQNEKNKVSSTRDQRRVPPESV